ncbi:MAG: AsmA-like C-terminal domain-containing protein [Magnetococcales bacterium]|nr:AsmA-like C-terminal domain-containing protein [Magnetococcales bacterium]
MRRFPQRRFMGWMGRILAVLFFVPMIGLCCLWLWLVLSPPDLAPLIPSLVRTIEERSGWRLRLEGLDLHPGLSLMLEGRKVRFSSPQREGTILEADTVWLRFSPLQWLQGWPALSLIVDAPELNFRRDREGNIFLGDQSLNHRVDQTQGQKNESDRMLLPVGHVVLVGAKISWLDENAKARNQPPSPIQLRRSDLGLFLEPDGVVRVTLEARMIHGDMSGPVRFSGIRNANGDWNGNLTIDPLRLPERGLPSEAAPPGPMFSGSIHVSLNYLWLATADRFQCDWKVTTLATHLHLPRLFRWPIPVNRGEAWGTFARDRTHWDLEVERFAVANTDGSAEGSLKLMDMEGTQPLIDLVATARGIPTDRAKIYYPAHIMHSGLVRWLEQSLHGGEVRQVQVHIKGPLKEIPFATPAEQGNPETVFSIQGEVEHLDLTFFPGVPDLKDSVAKVSVDRLEMVIRVPKARFGNTPTLSGKVRIADMVHQPMVEIEALLPEVDLESTWKTVVANSKLHWDQAAGLQGMKISGSGKADLSLLLPLANLKDAWFGGTLTFDRTRIAPPFLDAPLEQAKGRLSLDPYRLNLELNQATFQQKPISLVAEATSYRVPGKALVTGRIDTRFQKEEIERLFSALLGSDGSVEGEAPMVVNFKRPPGSAQWDLFIDVRANRLGIRGGLDWFKSMDSVGAVIINGRSDLQGAIKIDSLQVDLGNLSLMGAGSWHLRTSDGALNISRFRLQGHQGALKILHTSEKNDSGPESWIIEARMNRLDFAPMLEQTEHTEADHVPTDQPSIRKPVTWPRIEITVHAAHFSLANDVRGREMDARMSIDNHRMALHHLLGKIGDSRHRAHGELRWPARLGRGPYVGSVHLDSGDIGRLFQGWNIQEAFLQGGQAKAHLTLDGFLPPGDKLKNHVSGKVDFSVTQGTIARLGFLSQVLGLFSLEELPNLVFLDRPDLTADGFHYDRIQGTWNLERSVATLDELDLDGPSMKMVVSGSIHFPQKKLNLLLGIRPIQTLDRIISSVPLLGKLVAGQRESVVETLFDIEGTMDEPRVSIRPVASIIPGIVRDILTQPDDPNEKPGAQSDRGKGEAVP